jgi:hypothetical protein
MFAYGVTSVLAIGEARRMDALARAYAFESMAPRLAYETEHRPAIDLSTTVNASHTMSDKWDKIEADLDSRWSPRQIAIERLHARTVNKFIASPAFGVGRMTHMANEQWLARGNDPSVPQLCSTQPNDASPEPGNDRQIVVIDSPRPALDHAPNQFDLWALHKSNLSDFLSVERFGLVRDRDRVAGFLSHRLSARATLGERALPPADRLELVSLLKFEQPQIYVSTNLPRMEDLKDAPTRSLDAFERSALDSLVRGEDIVTADEPRALRTMGAIRALKQCSHCHTVERGELLGAFSYTWWHGPGKPEPKKMQPDAT